MNTVDIRIYYLNYIDDASIGYYFLFLFINEMRASGSLLRRFLSRSKSNYETVNTVILVGDRILDLPFAVKNCY